MVEAQFFSFVAAHPTDATSQAHRGATVYRLLTGVFPAEAHIASDTNFDRHVLASILAAAAMDGGLVPGNAGLSGQELALLLEHCFPAVEIKADKQLLHFKGDEDEEVAMIRDLLLGQQSTKGRISGWLAAMVARRAIEPNHLWEDLGLRNRGELSRLLSRHFAPLAARNINNMRWKRFFYRTLCENDGLVMCTAPVCTQCNEFNVCFGAESGESRMAERRRDVLRQGAPSSVTDSRTI
ncbi:nitrogen fixation protein NifQ [Bradyrhizobium sp. CCGB12]|uniref:nitrogen fixation protein NifQ n=1 Tax=Bradyrhizobium sp. CCGB12 TaxID=2949632 RepID=UPI0020B3493A|nr:nitrogen fixation protein NifQ [Bradyrhizobium sp. CCGB12]MCP3392417.1 nitrogen fixation protein NifQ [Bradyrhizobium sp. CCGB12]